MGARRVLDTASRQRRLRKALDALEQDNFQDDPHAGLKMSKKAPRFDETMLEVTPGEWKLKFWFGKFLLSFFFCASIWVERLKAVIFLGKLNRCSAKGFCQRLALVEGESYARSSHSQRRLRITSAEPMILSPAELSSLRLILLFLWMNFIFGNVPWAHLPPGNRERVTGKTD